jgi:hypothetical protein
LPPTDEWLALFWLFRAGRTLDQPIPPVFDLYCLRIIEYGRIADQSQISDIATYTLRKRRRSAGTVSVSASTGSTAAGMIAIKLRLTFLASASASEHQQANQIEQWHFPKTPEMTLSDVFAFDCADAM